MAQVKSDKKMNKFKVQKTEYISKLKETLLIKYFESEFEIRIQNRVMLTNVNAVTVINGQKVKITDYITLLKKDLTNLETRITLIEDLEDELK